MSSKKSENFPELFFAERGKISGNILTRWEFPQSIRHTSARLHRDDERALDAPKTLEIPHQHNHPPQSAQRSAHPTAVARTFGHATRTSVEPVQHKFILGTEGPGEHQNTFCTAAHLLPRFVHQTLRKIDRIDSHARPQPNYTGSHESSQTNPNRATGGCAGRTAVA